MAIPAERERQASAGRWRSLGTEVAATMDCEAVLEIVGSTPQGLQASHAKRTTTDHPAREDAAPSSGKPIRARCS
jgi:hypothetical protein